MVNSNHGSMQTTKEKKLSEQFEELQASLDKLATTEEKIRSTIDFMKLTLSQEDVPSFREFWEARRLCLSLFKAHINPIARLEFWKSYEELTKEARHLKEILDEQTAFEVEQIDIAIQVIEDDIQRQDELVEKMTGVDFFKGCKALLARRSFYDSFQKGLNILNTFASRINAIRKEVVKTNMRIRQKNKFLKRLSVLGDRVFPERKEAITKISDEFSSDIENFVKAFDDKVKIQKVPSFLLKEEIKNLQSIAKQLTLNTRSFTETRLKLSKCWDLLREEEKRSKEEKKGISQKHLQSISGEIEKFAEICAETSSIEIMEQKYEEIIQSLNNSELCREDKGVLEEKLARVYLPCRERERIEGEQKRHKKTEEKEQMKEREKRVKEGFSSLLKNRGKLSIDKLSKSVELLLEEWKKISVAEIEGQIIEMQVAILEDIIAEKREEKLIKEKKMGEDVLVKIKERRKKIKIKLENCRKIHGGGGLDFERAIIYGELLEVLKERLEKANNNILKCEGSL